MNKNIGQTVLKAIRKKYQITYKGKSVKIVANLQTDILKTLRLWAYYFKS